MAYSAYNLVTVYRTNFHHHIFVCSPSVVPQHRSKS